jgi:hypothetical protein
MRLNSEYRKYARIQENGLGKLFFHPGIPAQAYHVVRFMEQHGVDPNGMTSLEHLFYITQGFLIDYEGAGNILAEYLADMDGKALDEAWQCHMSHPLMTEDIYVKVNAAFRDSRDNSTKDPDPPQTDAAIEKKDKT